MHEMMSLGKRASTRCAYASETNRLIGQLVLPSLQRAGQSIA